MKDADVESASRLAARVAAGLVTAFDQEELDEFEGGLADIIEARDRIVATVAARRERERCARVCEEHAFALYDTARGDGLRFCAAAIRALPDPEPANEPT